ncbi:hypothetical protein BJF78_00535 [Pseudonocardia sp. CNS-139]|nr:hypothetical protein BJF78_00535 [Pseudonocardia sp. CNS-139]
MTGGNPAAGRTVGLPAADGLTLAGDAWGDPPWDAVLLHGGGQTRSAWGRTGSRLHAHGLSVLSVDLRGHGTSAWDEAGRYSFRDHGRDLAAILAANPRPVIAVGASLGGSTSLHAALLRPEKFRAVVLVDIAPTMQRTGVNRIVGFMRSHPDGFASIAEAQSAVAAYQSHRRRPPGDGLRRNLRETPDGRWVWHWDPRTLDFANEGWYLRQQEDMTAAIRALDVPVILVRGAESDVIVDSDVAYFAALGAHTRHVEVPNARHMVAGDENDVFLDQIIAELGRALPSLGPAA